MYKESEDVWAVGKSPALFVMDLSSISIADEPVTAKKVKSIEYERDVSF